jgi:hypothetical protein
MHCFDSFLIGEIWHLNFYKFFKNLAKGGGCLGAEISGFLQPKQKGRRFLSIAP